MINRFKNLTPVLAYVIASIFLILFQSSRRFSLWDFSNYTDIGTRVSLGSIPYLDFPLYTQPGSFIEIALALKLFGYNIFSIYFLILLKTLILGCLIQYLLKCIFPEYKKINTKYQTLILATLSITNPWFIIPQSTYDADLSFAIVLCTTLIIGKLEFNFLKKSKFLEVIQICVVTFAAWFPFLYKQTSGALWAILIHAFIFLAHKQFPRYTGRKLLIGDSILLIFVVFVQIRFNLIEIWKVNVIDYPISQRLNSQVNPLNQLIEVFNLRRELVLILAISLFIFIVNRVFKKMVFFVIFSLISSTTILAKFYLFYIFQDNQPDWAAWDKFLLLIFVGSILTTFLGIITLSYPSYLKQLQVILLTTCSANFISQGIVNSSYAFWQIYFIILLISLTGLPKNSDNDFNHKNFYREYRPLYIFSIFVIIFGLSLYSFSQIRMSYIKTDNPISKYPKLYSWIGTPGDYLEETQIGIELFQKYSMKGKTTVWPGEDPVSLFSGVLPATNISTSDTTTNPEFNKVMSWLNDFKIEYVVWKTELQTPGLQESSNDALTMSLDNFFKVEAVGVYQVLKRK